MKTTCEVIVQKKTLQSKKICIQVAQNKSEDMSHDKPSLLIKNDTPTLTLPRKQGREQVSDY